MYFVIYLEQASVEVKDPLKQGLKQILDNYKGATSKRVEVKDPLKQGLKREGVWNKNDGLYELK